jgi:enediyne biosynthesis protein E4
LSLIGQAAGARITWSAGGVKRSRLKTAGGSYLSSHDPRELLGLGAAKTVDWIEVRWPAPSNQKDGQKEGQKGGRVDRFEKVLADRYYSLKEGGELQ